MNFLSVCGIDMSKEHFDAYLLKKDAPKKGHHAQFANDAEGFKNFYAWLKQHNPYSKAELLICIEQVGLYAVGLCKYLGKRKICYTLIAALEIKKSMGIVRGKNDKIDARRIARYAYEKRDTIRIRQLDEDSIRSLKTLLTTRQRLVKMRKMNRQPNKELKAFEQLDCLEQIQACCLSLDQQLDRQVQTVEEALDKLIEQNPAFKKSFDLLISVPGIGPIIAMHLIAVSHNFTYFDNAKQFAAYSGIAPYACQSGKALDKKARVSHIANKKIKALLSSGAQSGVRYNEEYRKYFIKQTEKGKNENSVINVIRNKMVARAFAVIRRNSPYVDTHSYAA